MTVFVPEVDALSDEEFCRHFLMAKSIALPEIPPPSREAIDCARKVVGGVFKLTGETHRLAPESPWLHNPSRDKEWQIALHKHDFAVRLLQALNATGDKVFLDAWIGLTESWLRATRPGCLTTSDAHVDAKRIENWVAAFQLLQKTPLKQHVDGAFLRRVLTRLADDATYVSQNLRPARNHRTFQLYALVLVGVVFPELSNAGALLALGREKLIENLLHDFGADGVHIEGSTHYHNITLETALAFIKISRVNALGVPHELEAKLMQALEFSAFVQFPDGEIPLLNDSDNGDHSAMLRDGAILFGRPDLLWAGSRGAEGLPPVKASKSFAGYAVLSDGWGHDEQSFARRQHVVFDCAPLGEGSHSHYDLMSLTWFSAGRQIIVDPGRFTYNAEPGADGLDWRHEFKSTRFHNTVEIDGRNQTRYLSKAKTVAAGLEALVRGRHKEKHGPEIQRLGCASYFGDRCEWVIAAGSSHEYRPVHTRAVIFVDKTYVAIIDHVEMGDDESHQVALRYHLAAGEAGRIRLSTSGGHHVLKGDGYALHVVAPPTARASIADGWVSKLYGVKDPAPVLEVMAEGHQSLSFLTLLAPDDALSLGDVTLVQKEAQVLEAVVQARTQDGEGTDHIQVKADGLGVLVARVSEARAPLWSTGNLSPSGEFVEPFELTRASMRRP